MLSCSEKQNYYLMNSIAWAQGTCYSFTVVLGFLSEKKKSNRGYLSYNYLLFIIRHFNYMHYLFLGHKTQMDTPLISLRFCIKIICFSQNAVSSSGLHICCTLSIVSLSSSLINSWPKPWVSLFTMAIFNPYGALPMQTQNRMICIDGRINWNRRNLMKKKKFIHCNSILFNQEIFFLPRVIQSP